MSKKQIQKRASAKPKIKQVRQFIEAGFANPTTGGEGDTFFIGNQDTTL
jgi:hypothetical protein